MRNKKIISTVGLVVIAGSFLLPSFDAVAEGDCSTRLFGICFKRLPMDFDYCLELMDEVDDTDISCIVPSNGSSPPILVNNADIIVDKSATRKYGEGVVFLKKNRTPLKFKQRSGHKDVMTDMETMNGQPNKIDAAPAMRDAKAAKFKAGKSLADTVKRNGNADDSKQCEKGVECK